MYSSAAVHSVFGEVTTGERVIELLNIAKAAAGRDVGRGRAVTPAVNLDGVAGVWRTNRHGDSGPTSHAMATAKHRRSFLLFIKV